MTFRSRSRVTFAADVPRRRPLGRTGRLRGMTMIELMVVMIILTVFMAFTIPAIQGTFYKSKLAKAARGFAVLAKYARRQAILRGGDTEIRVRPEEGRYQLDLTPHADKDYVGSADDRDRTELERVRELDPEKGEIHFVEFHSSTDPFGKEDIQVIRFRKNGGASAATVVIANESDDKMTIQIAAGTGIVRVYSGEPKEPEPINIPGEGDETEEASR